MDCSTVLNDSYDVEVGIVTLREIYFPVKVESFRFAFIVLATAFFSLIILV